MRNVQFEIEGRADAGDAIDLRDRSVDRAALVAAIRDDPSPYAVACPAPGPVHERAGVVLPGMGLKPRTALAAAARSRGIETPHDDRIDRLAADLRALSASIDDDRPKPTGGPPPGDLADLRERAAELRGQVAALAAIDADVTDARAELRETAARLSELETERIAAEQTRERTRELRDRRERRLRVEDRLANARRDARAALVGRVRDEYDRAVAAIRGDEGDRPADQFAVAAPVAALAVLHVARIRAPVVLDGVHRTLDADRFRDPAEAAGWLDAPVVRL